MQELTVAEKYNFFRDSFSHCGLFLLDLNDEDILYYLFEEFDTDSISFFHAKTLESLRQSSYINDEIVSMCEILRDSYLKLANKKRWGAEEIKTSPDWLELFHLADDIRMRLTKEIQVSGII